MWNFKVERMEHHVRFDDTVSECDSDVSWFSYISSSGKLPLQDSCSKHNSQLQMKGVLTLAPLNPSIPCLCSVDADQLAS